MKHLRIGGSTIARTLQCPAWVKRSENVPASQSNVAADIGSLLHKTMEIIEKEDVIFLDELIGKVEHNGQVLTRDHIEGPVKAAADMVDDIRFNNSAFNIYPEIFVELVADEIGGTIDVLLHSEENNQVWIIDYKFGRVPVENVANRQLLFYAVCAMNDSKTSNLFNLNTKIITTVIQPYCSLDPMSYTVTYNDLLVFEKKIRAAAIDANSPKPKAETGSHCKYCPYLAICPEYKELVTSRGGEQSHKSENYADKLADSLRLVTEVEAWVTDVKNKARELALTGVKLKGFDLVQGRKRNTWKKDAEKELISILGKKAYNTELISPAKALKLSSVDKELLRNLIEETRDRPQLVIEDERNKNKLFNFKHADKELLEKLKIPVN